MRQIFSLIISTCVVSLITILLFGVLPMYIGKNAGLPFSHHIVWFPGIGIALLAGSLGGFFNGLLEVWAIVKSSEYSKDLKISLSPIDMILRPFLGAIAGCVTFFISTAGGLALIDIKNDQISTGEYIFALRPRSSIQFSTWIVLTFGGGYLFDKLPLLLKQPKP